MLEVKRELSMDDLDDFLWSGARDRWDDADEDQREEVWDRLEAIFDHKIPTETEVNDYVWFECDDIFFRRDESLIRYEGVDRTRKDEFWGGRIGKVNAKSKDNADIVKALKGLTYRYPMNIDSNDYGFGVSCSFSINKMKGYRTRPYAKSYVIKIKESNKSKIVVGLFEGNRDYPKDDITGLILDPKKIKDAVEKLIKKNFSSEEISNMEEASATRSQLYDAEERDREAARNAKWDEEQRKQRELARKKDQEKSNSKRHSASSYNGGWDQRVIPSYDPSLL